MFYSVITKNPNREILTKNLKETMRWRMENFNIFGVHRKLRFIGGGGVHEKPICRGRIAYKRGGGLDSLHI